MNDIKEKIRPYLEAVPDIMEYQLITKLLLGIWLFVLGRLFRLLLYSTGRVAVTSGDFLFLFGTWQGILIILIALATLFIFVALDILAKIIMSQALLTGKEVSVLQSCLLAIRSVSKLFNLNGIGVALYILLIAPLFGIGFSITLTEGFYIPTFISSVIGSNPLYLTLAIIAALLFISLGIANLFILHGIVIDDLPIKAASKASKKIMKNNWQDFLIQNLTFILIMTAVLVTGVFAELVLPLAILRILPLSAVLKRGLTIFFLLLGVVLSLLVSLLTTPFYMMKATQLYYTYKSGKEFRYQSRKIKFRKADNFAVAGLIIVMIAMSVYLNQHFDDLFPPRSQVAIIAHRGGGNEGPENTALGLQTACQKGAFGSEIDIQRTKDGYYVLNHDGTFERVAGDRRKPEEMTLAEVRQLAVDGEPVPTLEEILDAASGKIILFIELKGATADQQMADDAIRIIKEKNMIDETVLISLKYDLIDYIETFYPEMQTGFLTFAAFGDAALLNCDYFGLEEETATADAIAAIHKQGKKVMIWTVNKKGSQHHFLCSNADGIITDEISQADEVMQEINNRSDLRRIIDKVRGFFS